MSCEFVEELALSHKMEPIALSVDRGLSWDNLPLTYYEEAVEPEDCDVLA